MAGLVAAYELKRAGHEVTVLEANCPASGGDAAWDEIVMQYDRYSTREFLEGCQWSEGAISPTSAEDAQRWGSLSGASQMWHDEFAGGAFVLFEPEQ
jgi:glycine/D-amino acid oxidase-like deaminating enzyme